MIGSLILNLFSGLDYLISLSFLWLAFFLSTAVLTTAIIVYSLSYALAPSGRRSTHLTEDYFDSYTTDRHLYHDKLPLWCEKIDPDITDKLPFISFKLFKNLFPPISGGNTQSAVKTGEVSPTVSASLINKPEVYLSVIIPAYNEELRLPAMLHDTVKFLDNFLNPKYPPGKLSGWEILVVSDGSTDQTVSVALDFALRHNLHEINHTEMNQFERNLRVTKLYKNSGKGAAVLHGLRHARGKYLLFADADGATKFSDLARLIKAADTIQDKSGRAVVIGSRAHLMSNEVVVKRSPLRNALMHAFHALLTLLSPASFASLGDTQCGFKLISREALSDIVPYMRIQGWIFDVELLMLAERAAIPICEVPVSWREIRGSKLNVVPDSLKIAYELSVIRLAWLLNFYYLPN